MSKTLAEIYKSPAWQKRRLEILSRDNFTCQLCGDTKTELQVHHIEYGSNPLETPSEQLITLCADCHYHIETVKIVQPYLPFDKYFFETAKILKLYRFSKSLVLIEYAVGQIERNVSVLSFYTHDMANRTYISNSISSNYTKKSDLIKFQEMIGKLIIDSDLKILSHV